MRIREVIRRKGDQVVTIRPDADVTTLLAMLAEHNIGAVVVSADDGATLSGIVSERDVVRRLQADGAAALSLPVADLMTVEVQTCVPEDALEELALRMTEHRIRHLPVVEDGRITAIVSIGDIVKHRIDELQEERQQLVSYIQH
ncbi:CBS domain-containing protein [Ornithinicoccus hortensis]|uniref:CBS domain protein n=1 Tax=Ornithinicoccus hortensis TaxID=82346 RepID=A0A542YS96_9MICO|nr:CBS domain-containing protein [Ornithinicoccus hortensis]TQL50972.1 CBS domain protein [Ornithinicoccus hortensis]